MKKFELLLTFLKLPLDAVLILLAFLAAYFFRAQLEIVPVIYLWPVSKYLSFVLKLLPFWVFVFILEGLYATRLKSFSRELSSIFIAVSSSMALTVVWIFLTKTDFFSRLIIIFAFIFAFVFVLLGRVFWRLLNSFLYRLGFLARGVILVGDNGITLQLQFLIKKNKHLGLKVLEVVKPGEVERLEEVLQRNGRADEIIVSDLSLSQNQILTLIDLAEERHLVFKQVPSIYELKRLGLEMSWFLDFPLMELKKTPLDGWGKILKRLFDLVASLFSLLLLSPVFLVVAILIKMDSRGPIFYWNERVGAEGKFEVIKFRSMKIEYATGERYGGLKALSLEEELIKKQNVREGGLYKIKDDPRVTKLGRFLRRSYLDELPQLINVLKGDLSLVGPRPHQEREVRHYLKDYNRVMAVKPGITGLAQISGASDLSVTEEVRLDNYYVENWSFFLDLLIIVKTFGALRRRRMAE